MRIGRTTRVLVDLCDKEDFAKIPVILSWSAGGKPGRIERWTGSATDKTYYRVIINIYTSFIPQFSTAMDKETLYWHAE